MGVVDEMACAQGYHRWTVITLRSFGPSKQRLRKCFYCKIEETGRLEEGTGDVWHRRP